MAAPKVFDVPDELGKLVWSAGWREDSSRFLRIVLSTQRFGFSTRTRLVEFADVGDVEVGYTRIVSDAVDWFRAFQAKRAA